MSLPPFRPPYWLLFAALFVWWLAFTLPTVMFNDVEASLASADATTRTGSTYNQAMVVSFAFLGVLARARSRPRALSREAVATIGLFVAYVAWSLTTTFWSQDPALSLRRLGQLLLLVVGAGGLGAGLYGAQPDGLNRLCRHVLISAVGLILMLVTVLILRGELTGITNPDWSLKSSVALSVYGYYLGYAALAAFCLFRPKRSIHPWAFGLCLVLLVALKGRGVVLSTIAAGGIVLFRSVHNRLARAVALIAGIAATCIVLDLGTGGHVIGSVAETLAATVLVDYLTLGAGVDNVLNLSGRAPLWDVLLEYVQRNPFGYGFGAFWTPTHLLDVRDLTGWPAVNAHNGLLDEVLATGLIGVCLVVALWLHAVRISVKAGQIPMLRDGAILIAGWLQLMFLFNMTDSTLQFFFQVPPILTLIGVSALLSQMSRQSTGRRARSAVAEASPVPTPRPAADKWVSPGLSPRHWGRLAQPTRQRQERS